MSHQSMLPVTALFLHQDKLLHAGAYGFLALLAINYFKYQCDKFNHALFVSFLFCALYGASDEFHQSFVEGRQDDMLDWLADCLGAFVMLSAYKWIRSGSWLIK